MNDKESIRENMDTKFPVSYQIDREIRKLAIDESIKGVLHGIDGYIVLSKKMGLPRTVSMFLRKTQNYQMVFIVYAMYKLQQTI